MAADETDIPLDAPTDGATAADGRDVPAAPKHIPVNEQRRLWVRCGGRCVLCNKYLLEDEFTAQPVPLGELAHNVGRKQSAASPRGLDPLPIGERNLAENLLLLCGDHHRVIDARVAQGDFTVEDLRRLKAKHEERIHRLTGMGEDSETVVVRIVGDIRGAPVELDARSVRKAVVEHAGRYPHYGLAYRGADVEVDLRTLPGEGTALYWQMGQQAIDERLGQQLTEAVAKNEVRHLSVFGLARIPLLAYAGLRLDDKVPVDVYQKHRDQTESWVWNTEAPTTSFEVSTVRAGTDPAKGALLLSLSGSVDIGELPDEITDEWTIWEIRPTGATPNRNVLASPVSLQNFADTYHGFLSELEARAPRVSTVEVFPAVPVSAALIIGRGLMRDVHPSLRIFDRDGEQSYEFALELST